jgi:hypothetical protein
MAIRFEPGCLYVSLVLFVPAIVAAYFLHSAVWLLIVPPGIIVGFIALGLLMTALGVPKRKRKVTPEQFADRLERHLLRNEDEWDWHDYVTSPVFADERLERVRWKLFEFDAEFLSQETDKEKLRAIIEALRRGELPEIVPPKDLTSGKR